MKVKSNVRLWNLGVLAGICTLIISNILLTIRLFHSANNAASNNNCPAVPIQSSSSRLSTAETSSNTLAAPCMDDYAALDKLRPNSSYIFEHFDHKLGRWDKTRQYKIFDNIIVGSGYTQLSDNYSVCLASQSSLERLGSLVQIATHWSGPISVAIFTAGDKDLHILQLYLTYLRTCFRPIEQQVAFHLVFSRLLAPTRPLRDIDLELDLPNYDCDQPDQILRQLVRKRDKETKGLQTNPYPQNHMRNVARKGCQNDYVFLVDIDIQPSLGMAPQLDKFIKSSMCPTTAKCAYVIPTFEIDQRANVPRTKADILSLVQRKLARPFHQKVFIYNQFATNFSRWQSTVDWTNETHVSYNVTNFEFLYEPFYVSKDADTPEHDERFIGYGFTRNTQVYEMFVAGFSFYVLSPVFTLHPGLQNRKPQLIREQQNNKNRRSFDGFKREVFARYKKDPLRMMAVKEKEKKPKRRFKL